MSFLKPEITLFTQMLLAFNGLHVKQIIWTSRLINCSIHRVCWNSLSQLSKEKRTTSQQSVQDRKLDFKVCTYNRLQYPLLHFVWPCLCFTNKLHIVSFQKRKGKDIERPRNATTHLSPCMWGGLQIWWSWNFKNSFRTGQYPKQETEMEDESNGK